MKSSFAIFEHFPPPPLFKNIHANTNGFVFITEIEANTKTEALNLYLYRHQEKYQISSTNPDDADSQVQGWFANYSGKLLAESETDIIMLHDCEVLAIEREKMWNNEGMAHAWEARKEIFIEVQGVGIN